MDIAIDVKGLSKQYKIGRRQSYQRLTETLSNLASAPINWLRAAKSPVAKEPDNKFWALKDVSFQVKKGEVIGIIGRNGAGKSTLLKVLSRITEPTSGDVWVHGRVGSLLEVGTGFHPELTGRENIYLNGAILGMRRREIASRFDEIVAFAEVEKFLDTPVKHYSSGMYMRLAFAVAAHLEPEILMVDEVLAVGDAGFQKKCLGKMGEVASSGRTVLFVSHNLGAITSLCSTSIYLASGRIAQCGPTNAVIQQYLHDSISSQKDSVRRRKANGAAIWVSGVQSVNDNLQPCIQFLHDESIHLRVSIEIEKWVDRSEFDFFVTDQRGRRVFTWYHPSWSQFSEFRGTMELEIIIPSNFLVPGTYFFSFDVTIPNLAFIDRVESAIAVEVVDGGSPFAMHANADYGCVFVDCAWRVQPAAVNNLAV